MRPCVLLLLLTHAFVSESLSASASTSASSSAAGAGGRRMNNPGGASSPLFTNDWFYSNDCQVLLPSSQRVPKSVVHFCGGYLLGSASPVAYSSLFAHLADSGHAIISSQAPLFETNHGAIARDMSQSFSACYRDVVPLLGKDGRSIPVIGLSHSLGGKLMALICSRKEDRRMLPLRAGNIFLAFNNYGFQQSLALSAKASPDISKFIKSTGVQKAVDAVKTSGVSGLLDGIFSSIDGGSSTSGSGGSSNKALFDIARRYIPEEALASASNAASAALDFEFSPTPAETWNLLVNGYSVEENIVFKFSRDEIDQSDELRKYLIKRGGVRVTSQTLPGDHLTPTGDDVTFLRTLSLSLNTLASNHNENRRELEQRMLPPTSSSST